MPPAHPIHQAGDCETLSCQEIENIVAEAIANTMPMAVSNLLTKGGSQSVVSPSIQFQETRAPETGSQLYHYGRKDFMQPKEK